MGDSFARDYVWESVKRKVGYKKRPALNAPVSYLTIIEKSYLSAHFLFHSTTIEDATKIEE